MTDASPTIAMGSDHRGYEAVDSISEHLRAAGWSIEILGRSESDEPSVDYPDVAAEVTAAASRICTLFLPNRWIKSMSSYRVCIFIKNYSS